MQKSINEFRDLIDYTMSASLRHRGFASLTTLVRQYQTLTTVKDVLPPSLLEYQRKTTSTAVSFQ